MIQESDPSLEENVVAKLEGEGEASVRHSPTHQHPLSQSELFLPLETGKINHCAQNSRSLDWLAECCQFVGGPKTILIEVCRCTSHSQQKAQESDKEVQKVLKSGE